MKKRMLVVVLVLSFVTGMAFYNSKPIASAKVRLSKKNVAITQGDFCTIKLKGAKNKKVVWKSNDKKIATVKKGKIKAKKIGRCSVIAKYNGRKYKCSVQVKKNKSLTPEPTNESDATLPSASPQSSWETNVEANENDAKLVIDRFVKDTKVITYSIYNFTQNIITLPAYYGIEKYNGKEWVELSRKTNYVTANAQYIMPGDKSVNESGIESSFGELEQGKYRICVITSCGKVCAEFDII